MHDSLLPAPLPHCLPLIPMVESEFTTWLERQDEALRRWLTTTGFKAKSGSFSLIPGADGQLQAVVVNISQADDLWAAALAEAAPSPAAPAPEETLAAHPKLQGPVVDPNAQDVVTSQSQVDDLLASLGF